MINIDRRLNLKPVSYTRLNFYYFAERFDDKKTNVLANFAAMRSANRLTAGVAL